MEKKKPVVSIVCMTYNHKPYIRNAIEGILSQKTDFLYEVIIHDDASTDGTTQIIKDYEKKYPEIIRGIYREKNIYEQKMKVAKEVMNECKGKFIAFCEGDDCWIDNNKLQIQVDYMEKKTECVLTVHNVLKLECDSGSMQSIGYYSEDKDLSEKEVIVYHERIATVSYVFRKDVFPEAEFFWNAGVGDYTLLLYFILKGKIHYFDRIMSVYRYKSKGSWTEQMMQNRQEHFENCVRLIYFLEQYNKYTGRKYEPYIIDKIHYFVGYMVNSMEKKNVDDFDELCCKFKQREGKYNKYFLEMHRIFLQTHYMDYCSYEIMEFAKNNRHIIIMGTGKYADIVSEQLSNNCISFEGFTVSYGEKKESTYKGKQVWEIQEIPYNICETGIIIGINPVIWSEIESSLRGSGITNYICPFLMKELFATIRE